MCIVLDVFHILASPIFSILFLVFRLLAAMGCIKMLLCTCLYARIWIGNAIHPYLHHFSLYLFLLLSPPLWLPFMFVSLLFPWENWLSSPLIPTLWPLNSLRNGAKIMDQKVQFFVIFYLKTHPSSTIQQFQSVIKGQVGKLPGSGFHHLLPSACSVLLHIWYVWAVISSNSNRAKH